VPEGLNDAVGKWLDPKVAPIRIDVGEQPSFPTGPTAPSPWSWNDPELRRFETLGAGNCGPITWSG
jgi:hypothetical protein